MPGWVGRGRDAPRRHCGAEVLGGQRCPHSHLYAQRFHYGTSASAFPIAIDMHHALVVIYGCHSFHVVSCFSCYSENTEQPLGGWP